MPLGTPVQAFSGEPVDEAAFLSASAYVAGPSLKAQLDSKGWTLINLPGTTDGYYIHHSTPPGKTTPVSDDSVAFAAIKGNTIAISLRGSVPSQLTGDVGAASDHPKVHYNNVVPFINEVVHYAVTLKDELHNPVVQKILITGQSLGGQTSELFAVDPTGLDEYGNRIPALDLDPYIKSGRFQPQDVSIITFESPGIPKSANDGHSPLQSRVFDYYNTQDQIYSILVNTLGYVHIGNQRPFYEAETQITPSDLLKVHNDTYQTYTQALAKSQLSNHATPGTIFAFGEKAGDHSTAVIDANKIGNPQTPHFIVGLGANETMKGGLSNDFFEAIGGNHIMTGGGGQNQYEFFSRSDIITDFSVQKDVLLFQPSQKVTGTLQNGTDSVLTYSGGTVTLKGVDLGPVASQYTWLQWNSVPFFFTLGG